MRAVLAFLAVALLRLLGPTWRIRLVGPDPGEGAARVFCFWHGRQAGLLAHPRRREVAVLASRSRDGDLQARVLSSLGFSVIRGSSSRGGAEGLKGIIEAVRAGRDAAFAVDGPRGPLHVAKPGAAMVAAASGGVLVPITARPSRAWVLRRAWDRYALPVPFSRVDLVRGPSIPVGSTADVAACTERLQTALDELDG